jgi:hypothetical protein
MRRIYKYDSFINEEFFKKIIDRKKVEKKPELDSCVEEIMNFLNENGIWTWDDFITSGKFDRDVINKLIDHAAKDMKELNEIRFKLRLELSNSKQLREWIKELEEDEDYEKCATILKKINNK